MPRYRFTARDVQALRGLLSAPLVKEALRAAVPVRRFDAPRPPTETVELPVAIRSRDRPDGVPLTAILAALKERSPSVAALAVRGSAVFVSHHQEPSAAERKRLAQLLGDRDALLELRARPTPPDAAAPEEAELRRVLLDDATPNDEWLRAFRRYAVAELIERRPE